MLFHFLNFSQCVCLGIKRSTKLWISKSTPKGDISCTKKILFKNYNEWLVWTTKLFCCICDITKINPAYWNSTGWRVGRTLGWALHISTPKPWCFYITVFLMDTNCLQKMLDVIFYFILHIMSDKAAFVSGALLCVALPGKPRSLPLHCGTMV